MLAATCIEHLLVLLVQVHLLRPQDASGSSYSDPTDESSGWESVVLHGEQADQGSGPTESGLAMNSDSSLFLLCNLQELIDDVLRRASSIWELKVDMVNTTLLEDFLVVLRFVQTNYE